MSKTELNEFTETDVKDLQLVNWLAKANYKYKNFCYDRVKTPLLAAFGVPDGYDLQTFTRPEWDYDDECKTGNIFSWHSHVLQRFIVAGAVFHSPTNEFSYEDIRDRDKKSSRFDELKSQCKNTLEGIKEEPENFDKREAVRALRRLLHKFKPILRKANPKPRREWKVPFARTVFSRWTKTLDHWDIRVPNEIAVCSGCGSRLSFDFSPFEIEWWLEERRMSKRLGVYCDTYLFNKYHGECPELTRKYQSEFRRLKDDEPEPWAAETERIREWLPGILPALIRRELEKVKAK